MDPRDRDERARDAELRRDPDHLTPDRRDEPARRESLADRAQAGEDAVEGEAVGGVSGIAAGAAIGAVTGGPVGAVVGAAAGAAAGVGIAKGIEAMVNPEEEDRYWRENYRSRPYVTDDRDYEHYQPAYRYGWEACARHQNRRYEDIEPELERGWNQYRGTASIPWTDARPATRDAWERIEYRRKTQ